MSDRSSESPSSASGYEIVANLLVRQEQVLEELDELNTRIEATIKSLTAARQSQALAEQAGSIDPSVLASPATSAQSKAA